MTTTPVQKRIADEPQECRARLKKVPSVRAGAEHGLEGMLRIADVAAVLACSKDFVRQAIVRGEIGSKVLGGVRRVPVSALREYIDGACARYAKITPPVRRRGATR